MKFTVKDCDPTTGEADDEGYEDEYVVSAGGARSRPVCTRVRWLQFRRHKRALVFNLKNTCSSVRRKPGKYKNKYTRQGSVNRSLGNGWGEGSCIFEVITYITDLVGFT